MEVGFFFNRTRPTLLLLFPFDYCELHKSHRSPMLQRFIVTWFLTCVPDHFSNKYHQALDAL